VAPSALDQRVVEDRLVVVLAGDHDDLVPGAGVDDSFVVDLGSKAFGVDGWKDVTRAIHASPSVAATDDCDELAGLLASSAATNSTSGRRADPALLGGIVSLVAAVAALWLVRERDIERDAPIELPEPPITSEGQAALQPAAA
jgi:hypothetical protein